VKTIDHEIHELERRMAYRRHEIADTTRAAKARATRKLLSPAGLATAAGIGFVVTMGLMRKRQKPRTLRIKEDKPAGKIAGALSLLMPVAIAIIRAQFGSPAGMAQAVLEKMSRAPRRPSPTHDAPGLRPPVHPAR
jgi:hypothetical protein